MEGERRGWSSPHQVLLVGDKWPHLPVAVIHFLPVGLMFKVKLNLKVVFLNKKALT